MVCDDGDPCTDDSCAQGNCVHEPKDCDDQDDCTTDECDPATGDCIHTLNIDPNDLDCDGIPNGLDPDVDGDGIPNGSDPDVDGDGIPNGSDPDVDGDGIPNGQDDDIDGDGIPNDQDDDADGDGVSNDQDDDDDGDGGADSGDPTPGGCNPNENPCCGLLFTLESFVPESSFTDDQALFVRVNRNDSDFNGVTDMDETGPDANESDFLKMSVGRVFEKVFDVEQNKFVFVPIGSTTLSATSGASRIRVYLSPDRTELIGLPHTWSDDNPHPKIYIEGIIGSESHADVALQVLIQNDDADCENTFIMKLTVVDVDMDGDADHDGTIGTTNAEDDVECGSLYVECQNPGVVVLCNSDHDYESQIGGAPPNADNEDAIVNDGGAFPDSDDLSPLVIRQMPAIAANWDVTLYLASGANAPPNVGTDELVRVFSSTASDAIEILGPGTTTFLFPQNSAHGVDKATLAVSDIELGVEGLHHAAEVQLALIMQRNDGPNFGNGDLVQLTVAPFIMLPNTAAASRVLVTQNDQSFHAAVETLAGAVNVITPSVNDQWPQDAWEFGISARPEVNGIMPVAFETLRAGSQLQTWGRTDLIGPAPEDPDRTGLIKRQAVQWPQPDNDRLAYGGNLEITPPLPNNPLGRIVVGTDMPQVQKDFFIRQGVQTPLIALDASWLKVGHIDEFMAFTPDATGTGWRLVLANPDLAFQLLGSADPDLPLFYCDDQTEWISGEATGGTANTLIDNNPGVDFTTGNWQYVLIYDGPGEHQIGEIDSMTANTITISRSWRFEDAELVYKAITQDSTDSEIFNPSGWIPDQIPQGPDGPAQDASRYTLVSCSKQWLDGEFPANDFPACTTVWEFRHPDNDVIRNWNADAQNRIATTPIFDALAGATYDLSFVPAIYIGDPAADQAFAYVPGMVNFQVWQPWTTTFGCENVATGPAQVWLPKPFGPCVGGVDLFEQAAANELSVPGGIFFIDDWDTYHRNFGEVHCGTNVVRVPTPSDPHARWWEHVTP